VLGLTGGHVYRVLSYILATLTYLLISVVASFDVVTFRRELNDTYQLQTRSRVKPIPTRSKVVHPVRGQTIRPCKKPLPDFSFSQESIYCEPTARKVLVASVRVLVSPVLFFSVSALYSYFPGHYLLSDFEPLWTIGSYSLLAAFASQCHRTACLGILNTTSRDRCPVLRILFTCTGYFITFPVSGSQSL
jgi:hypothetical protein